ncbi:PD40 domain-containing protein [Actinomadura sp. NAK00032]|uniref:amidohydrolase family protein n=1 Tax=Actinomadura sp. NAK00032 TaxID=2742128 RepID=UPI001591E4FD|nr:amidohydrolase family protein [Actinomadura sp. NAK00032]QKW36909.1 PD40 domain-containing protein [Actinomadura sp. NAK00032]
MSAEDVSRRGFLGTSAAGIAAAVSPAAALPALAGPSAGPAVRTLTYTELTGGSVTASADGETLIAEVQGVLWRIPRRGGAAVRLTDWELEATRPALSPDGKTVAVCAYRGGGFHLWSMRSDGSGVRRLTGGPWDDRGAAWSPDGALLAFSSERGGDPVAGSAFGIWALDVGGDRLRRLTGGHFEDFDPAWSPDGRWLVCVRAAHKAGGGSDGGLALVRIPAAGGAAQVIRTVPRGRLLCPSVSPSGRVAYLHLMDTGDTPSLPGARTDLLVDGRIVAADADLAAAPPCWLGEDRLLYVAGGRIQIRTLSTSSVEQVTYTARQPVHPPRRRVKEQVRPAAARGIHLPALSPDGRSVAFVALNALWLMPLGESPRKLLQGAPVHYMQMPSWAPDGRSLLYCTDRDGLAAVHRVHLPVPPPRGSASGGVLQGARDELVAGGGLIHPVPSPDGTRLACRDLEGNLLLLDLGTGRRRLLARPLADDGPPGAPTWSPDGRHVAFCDRNRLNQRFREGYNLIRIIDTSTGADRRHLPGEHQSLSDRAACGPVWSPDGRWMALVAESALWLLPVAADGTPTLPARRLTDEPADHPSWAADSRSLLYLSSGRLRLLSLDATGAPIDRRTVPVRLPIRRDPPRGGDALRIQAGQLWDATGAPPRHNVDILITGDRITTVEPHRPRRPGHRTIDASRQTVIPGLFDSHTHIYQATYGARQNLLALAYGITTAACLGGPLYEAIRLRESADSRHGLGPRLLACAELIDGARTAYGMGRAHRTTAGVSRTLHRATALDVDFVKTYVRAPGETMARAASAAHRLGVPCGSHLCSPGRSAGQDLTTHLQATQRLPFGHATTPGWHIHQDLIEHYADGTFALIITPFTAQVLLGADPALAADPRVRNLMPPWDVAAVQERANTRPTGPQLQAMATEFGDYRRLADHGATIALGTDAPLVPVGLSVHLALRALHAHGFTPAQALHSATTTPARVFGLSADLGTVEPGKIADLTIVDGDPFTDFTTLVNTSLVLSGGIPHHQADLTAVHPPTQHTLTSTPPTP